MTRDTSLDTLAGAAAMALALGLMACASSRNGPEPDRQTHWQLCDYDDECGGLICGCGLCTGDCTTDADCREAFGSEARCMPPSSVSALPACGAAHAPGRSICLPACGTESGEGKPCAPPPEPLTLACTNILEGGLPPGVDVVANGDIRAFDATDDALYWATDEGIYRAAPTGASPERVVSTAPSDLAVDRATLVWSQVAGDTLEVRGLAGTSSGSTERTLSRRAGATASAPVPLTLDEAAIYWLSDGTLYRLPREGGEARAVAGIDGEPLVSDLGLNGEHLYLLSGTMLGETTVSRVSKRDAADGAANVAKVASGALYGLAVHRDYGFFAKQGAPLSGVAEDPNLIMRIASDADTAEPFARADGLVTALAVDDHDLLWATAVVPPDGGDANPGTSSIWRMPVDGEHDAVPIARGDFFAYAIRLPRAVHDNPSAPTGHAYVLVSCDISTATSTGWQLLRIPVP